MTLHSAFLRRLRRINPTEVSIFIKFSFLSENSVDVIVSDINPNMLEVGKKRATERGIFDEL